MGAQAIDQLTSPRSTPPTEPPLDAGDHLSRLEFEQRYKAHPEIKKAELIEGVVYIPSPVRFKQHSQPHSHIITWLGVYQASTPGTASGDNATVRLDFENEVQPDALLRLETELGGNSHITDDDYLDGPPELIIEIAASSAAYDMHIKRRVYARSGVREYLVLQVYEQQLDWFVLREGVYEPMLPDDENVFHSEIFPGLWLKIEAFWSGDIAAILATLQAGLSSKEHADFLSRLQMKD